MPSSCRCITRSCSRTPRASKLATIKHRLLTFTDAMDIEHDGAVVATVHRAIFLPLHHRAYIDLHDAGGRLEAVGNIIDKDFQRSATGTM